MTLELTSAGLTTRTLTEIADAIKAEIRSEISASMDLSTSSPQGQMVQIFAREVRKIEEALAALHAAYNPAGATGSMADILSALTGTVRRAATFSTVSATVNVDPGTYSAGSLVASVVGNPDAQFSNADEVVNSGGSAADVVVTYRALESGPVQAPSGTLQISGPVSGWNSITTAVDATPGEDIETDAALLVRRAQEVQAQGSTTVDAIRADISQNVSGVISVTVVENDTDTTVDSIPPHSFEAIVYGPAAPSTEDNEAVAAQIFASKPAGIRAYGSTSIDVADEQNNTHAIGFTRPTEIDAAIVVEGTVQTVVGIGLSGLKDDLAERANAVLAVGDNLDWSEIAAWAHELIPGLYRLSNVEVGTSGGSTTPFTNLTATSREIIRLDASDITLTLGDGLP